MAYDEFDHKTVSINGQHNRMRKARLLADALCMQQMLLTDLRLPTCTHVEQSAATSLGGLQGAKCCFSNLLYQSANRLSSM